jgi:predicted metalloprotease
VIAVPCGVKRFLTFLLVALLMYGSFLAGQYSVTLKQDAVPAFAPVETELVWITEAPTPTIPATLPPRTAEPTARVLAAFATPKPTQTPTPRPTPTPTSAPIAKGAKGDHVVRLQERLKSFVSYVLDDAQSTWSQVLPRYGAQYRPAKLVLFRDAIQSACGFAQSATGPFYCPADEKVYIDLGFYQDLQDRFGAPGDFAQAYVLAHEIGHHVQNLLGTEAEVRRGRSSRPELANQLSVRLELQADCYAGVWAHAARDSLEQGDVEEGLGAAAAVGDDRLQRMGGGTVAPEAFTHGSSADRVKWFRAGMEAGRPDACDTFGR